VVLGVEEQDGSAVLPPSGLSPADIEGAQKWIRGNCNRIDPAYQPVMSPEVVGDRSILVIWAPPSDTRPHAAPDGPSSTRKYWIRLGAETVDAKANGMLQPRLDQTARVPWDDRRALQARIEDLREGMVREHLRDIRSGLVDEPDAAAIYRRMRITVPVNDHEIPRNAGLLFFSDEPRQWFPGAWIEVVQFAADRAGDVSVSADPACQAGSFLLETNLNRPESAGAARRG
jgi:ATP-dependent DNA helicase RecG